MRLVVPLVIVKKKECTGHNPRVPGKGPRKKGFPIMEPFFTAPIKVDYRTREGNRAIRRRTGKGKKSNFKPKKHSVSRVGGEEKKTVRMRV